MTKKTRAKYLKFLGYGDYKKANIKRFQMDAFADPDEWDGRCGEKTQIALQHFYNVVKFSKNFQPIEFRCPCGRCTGYPVAMKVKEIKHLQTIRDHYKKPMQITSGIRCRYQNKKVGGDPESRHLSGRAADFHIKGVTDNLDGRREAVKYIKGLKNHRYTYGNGIFGYTNDKGVSSVGYISKPSMGNALHTEVIE